MTMINENDGFYKLAERISTLEEGEEFEWLLRDGDLELGMGAKLICEFDCYLVIMTGCGGGWEFIMWLDGHDINEVHDKIKKHYNGVEFAGFVA